MQERGIGLKDSKNKYTGEKFNKLAPIDSHLDQV